MDDLDFATDLSGLKAQVAALKTEAEANYAEMVQWRQQYELLNCILSSVSNAKVWKLARALRSLRRFLLPKKVDVDALVPWQHLEPKKHAPFTWTTTGDEPFFLIPCLLDKGWLRIHLRLTSQAAGRVELYVDSGGAFKLFTAVDVDKPGSTVDKRFVAHFPKPIRAVRLDPLDGPGEFHLEKLRVVPLPRPVALFHALCAKLQLLRNARRLGLGLRTGLGLLLRGDLGRFKQKLVKEFKGSAYYDSTSALATYSYDLWRQARQLTEADRARLRAEAETLADPPLISVLVPVYNVPERYLRLALDSVLRQLYPHWELCVADDHSTQPHVRKVLEEYARRDQRIKVVFRMQNGNISAATNSALAVAQGEYVALLDHDDELAEHALFRMAQAVVADRAVDMLYSDEDKLELDGRHVDPFFKPEWSPEYFLACMYTCHLGVYRTELVREVGGFRSDFDSAQDYDLVLRLMANGARIRHVPEVLYHWRKLPTSTASDGSAKPQAPEVARRALRSYLEQTGRAGTVEPAPTSFDFNRVRFALVGRPKVSIVLASACKPAVIDGASGFYVEKCIRSIRDKSTYDNYELILISNNDVPAELAERLRQWRVNVIVHKAPFNWSAVNNLGAAAAAGEYVLFMNDDMEVITPDWLEAMLEFAQLPEVGAVGAKLLYPDGRLQHAGVTVLDGDPTHVFHQYPGYHPGYFFGNVLHRNVCAVTGACLLTRKDVFQELGGFDVTFPLEFNDVDFCLKLLASGRRIVYMPYAQLYHFESATRRSTVTLALKRFKDRWSHKIRRDPYHNPNLSTKYSDCRIDVGAAA
jgi:GT2 family glycosyltransferase